DTPCGVAGSAEPAGTAPTGTTCRLEPLPRLGDLLPRCEDLDLGRGHEPVDLDIQVWAAVDVVASLVDLQFAHGPVAGDRHRHPGREQDLRVGAPQVHLEVGPWAVDDGLAGV